MLPAWSLQHSLPCELHTEVCDFSSSHLPVHAAADTAAAREKAHRKLLKIQGITKQADKAHTCVIVDTVILDDNEGHGGDGANSRSSFATGQGVEAVAGASGQAGRTNKRSSKQGSIVVTGSYSSNNTSSIGEF